MSSLQVGDRVPDQTLLCCQLSQRQGFIINLDGFQSIIIHLAARLRHFGEDIRRVADEIMKPPLWWLNQKNGEI